MELELYLWFVLQFKGTKRKVWTSVTAIDLKSILGIN